jgi:hypothetical protein
MPRQPDLFGHAALTVQPESGRAQPRLWVRRLTIWSDSDTRIRDIELRPGLNIIWSPDPSDQSNSGDTDYLGHGSGKTLFCRLLRFCLGEERYAPDEQRLRIATALPEGWVSAEVLVDGALWGVVRPLGAGRPHYAVPDASPEELLAGNLPPTGIEPLLEVVERQIVTPGVAALIPGEHRLDAWRVALALLTRDQECRFDRVLEWRSADSDSGSPTRSMSAAKHLDALRAFVDAIVAEELQLRAEISALDERYKASSQDVARRKWASDRLRAEVATAVGLSPDDLPKGRLSIEALRKAATQNVAGLARVSPCWDAGDVEVLRAEYDEQRQLVSALEQQLAVAQAQLPEIDTLVRRMRGEMPGISAQVAKSATPICPVCEVPIDRALAEACGMSHKLPDLQAIRDRRQCHIDEIATEERRRKEINHSVASTLQALVQARVARDAQRARVRAAQRFHDARSGAWFKARRVIDDVKRLDGMLSELDLEEAQAGSHAAEVEEKRELTGTFREAQREVFDRLSRFFDGVIREIVGPMAQGKVSLDGNGLKLVVELGGERSTAAIDSLKVIAFDLAVMCMSIEGGTRLPAFLLHDSPREADLGLSVYHRLFALAKGLEAPGPALFQYIVTTTTQPPDEVQIRPWLRESLRGSPAQERLLRLDL